MAFLKCLGPVFEDPYFKTIVILSAEANEKTRGKLLRGDAQSGKGMPRGQLHMYIGSEVEILSYCRQQKCKTPTDK